MLSVVIFGIVYGKTIVQGDFGLEQMTNNNLVVLLTLATQFGLGYVLLARYKSDQFPKNSLKISFNQPIRDFFIALAFILLTYIILVILSYFLNQIPDSPDDQSALNTLPKSYWWFFLLSAVIIAPIIEEIFFRGYLFPIIAARGVIRGLVVSSAIFALLHFPSVASFVQLFVLGVVLGYAYLKTGNLLVSMFIHALKNGIAFLFWFYLL